MRKPRVLTKDATWNRIKRGFGTMIRMSTASTSRPRGTPRVFYDFVLVHRDEARATAVSVCERCMKGNERGGGVADEETTAESRMRRAATESRMRRAATKMRYRPSTSLLCSDGNESPVHRSDARADGVGVRARSMRRKERGGGVAEGDDDKSGDEIDRDDDDDGGGYSDGDDDATGGEGGLAGVVCARERTRKMGFAF
ncbi:hypothetical protein Scep_026553 [Stephania cephalantha]|uniref:Uncharacterized protein n=1 Tax=Stephania cephalantha TaxID=152367 RepID=A0AAP0HQI8_9MAGN